MDVAELFEGRQAHVEVFASDVQPINVGLVKGSDQVLFKVFLGAGRRGFYLVGAGVGLHFGDREWLDIDATIGVNQAFTDEGSGLGRRSWYRWESDLLAQLRVAGGVNLGEHVAVFAGPTLNYMVSFGPNAMLPGSYLPPLAVIGEGDGEGGGGGHQVWLGLHGGLRL